jgi:chitinase
MRWAAGGWRSHWDETAMVPYLSRVIPGQVITFDTPESIAIKCDFARVNNLRGVMIWALGQDVLEGRQLLLETVGTKKWEVK